MIARLKIQRFNNKKFQAWDIGKGFKIAEVYKSGWSTVAVSVLVSLLIAIAL